MKLAETISLMAGGQGSGCRGSNCGRPMTDAIKGLVKEIRQKYAMCPSAVNHGQCKTVAKALTRVVPGAKVLQVGGGYHYFVQYKGKFYDVERPRGVDDWKQLPVIKEGMGWGGQGKNWKPKRA